MVSKTMGLKTRSMNTNDEFFMRLALAEAKKAIGRTSPNPCVGAVIVKNGKILATGYHEKAGTPHAEIHALNKAGSEASGSTMYVTLEPCNHTGRTPPCSHAVAASGIQRVVIGMLDPNPLVDGSGRQYLRDNHIEVVTGVLEDECKSINKPFIHFITSGRPLVALKAGLSLDGRLNYQVGTQGWITGPESGVRVHNLRNQYDAILVGGKTVKIDNPTLTTRLEKGGRDPVRVILDSQLAISPSAKIFGIESDAQTWVFHNKEVKTTRKHVIEETGARLFGVDCNDHGFLELRQVLDILGKNGLISVLVEGGGKVHSSFLKEQLADVAHLFYAPVFAGSAGDSFTPDLHLNNRDNSIKLCGIQYTRLGEDILVEGDILYPS